MLLQVVLHVGSWSFVRLAHVGMQVACLHVLRVAATHCCEAAAHSEAGCSLDSHSLVTALRASKPT